MKAQRGIMAIRAKMELANVRHLTVEDGKEVDRELNECCEAHGGPCQIYKACDRENNKLSTLLPPYLKKLGSQ